MEFTEKILPVTIVRPLVALESQKLLKLIAISFHHSFGLSYDQEF